MEPCACSPNSRRQAPATTAIPSRSGFDVSSNGPERIDRRPASIPSGTAIEMRCAKPASNTRSLSRWEDGRPETGVKAAKPQPPTGGAIAPRRYTKPWAELRIQNSTSPTSRRAKSTITDHLRSQRCPQADLRHSSRAATHRRRCQTLSLQQHEAPTGFAVHVLRDRHHCR